MSLPFEVDVDKSQTRTRTRFAWKLQVRIDLRTVNISRNNKSWRESKEKGRVPTFLIVGWQSYALIDTAGARARSLRRITQ